MPLTLHLSETPSGQSNSLANFPVESTVSLERLLAHKFALDWFEAVAILLRACENWNDEQRALSFDPAHVIVRVDGSVAATASAGRSSIVDPATAVQNSAALLRDLVPELFPMPLRLALTQALSTPPFYASIKEFSEALRYFERPDRKAIVQAVFERWKETREQHTRSAAEPHQSAEHVDTPIQHVPRVNVLASKRPAILWGLATAAVVCVPLTLWLWLAPAGTQNPMRAVESLGNAVINRGASIAGNLLARIAPARPRSDKQPTPTTESPTVTVASRPATNGRIASPVAAINQFSNRPAMPRLLPPPRALSSTAFLDGFRGPATTGSLPSLVSGLELSPLSEGVDFDPYPSEIQVTMDPATVTRIYSATDPDVVPPIAVYPHLPASAFVAQDNALMFDVLINPAGRVESVKSLRSAVTMGSTLLLTMNLSAAKSWRFEPAVKDGQTVRYRHTVWIPLP